MLVMCTTSQMTRSTATWHASHSTVNGPHSTKNSKERISRRKREQLIAPDHLREAGPDNKLLGVHRDILPYPPSKEMRPPTDKSEMRGGVLGLAGFYRDFIKDFSGIAKPLYDLLSPRM